VWSVEERWHDTSKRGELSAQVEYCYAAMHAIPCHAEAAVAPAPAAEEPEAVEGQIQKGRAQHHDRRGAMYILL